MTVSTVGYGDVHPTTMHEQHVSVVMIVLGAFLYAYIIGDFGSLIATVCAPRCLLSCRVCRTLSSSPRYSATCLAAHY